jgi:hypothetical protein
METKAARIARLTELTKSTDLKVRADAYRQLLKLNVYIEGHFFEHEIINNN